MHLMLADGLNLIRRLYAAVEQQPAAIESTIARASSILHQLMADSGASHLALVMEDQSPTWRHQLWPDYKKNRSPMPEALHDQLAYLVKQLQNNGIANLQIDNWEADDVIATMATKAKKHGLMVTIVSTDKGFCQLVDDQVQVRNHFDQVTFDRLTVVGRWGFEPERLIDFWAMAGDSTNHLPGVSGIGPKGASKVLDQANSLNRALAFPDLIDVRLAKQLADDWQSALLTRELATLTCDVPLRHNLHDFRYSVPTRKNDETLSVAQ